MNYYKALFIIIGSHVARCVADWTYFNQCTGLIRSVFAWNSPTCRGLRWVSDSAMTNVVSITGVYALEGLQALTA